MVYKWLNIIQSICLPHICVICKEHTENHISLCDPCFKRLKPNNISCKQCAIPLPQDSPDHLCGNCLKKSPFFDSTRTLFLYQPPLRQLVHRLKFGHQLVIADLFGQLMAEMLDQSELTRPECILPVPLSASRMRQRGFNQSVELARPVQRKLEIRIDSTLISRTHQNESQSRLHTTARKHNVRNAFTVNRKHCYQHVAIVYDVMTTGATCNELARILKQSGTKRVDIWCLARSTKDLPAHG